MICLILLLQTSASYAVRPFITDDARVVGDHLGQIESWIRYEAANFQHWIMPAYGPLEWLELSLGVVHGVPIESSESQYSFAGPILQGKALIFPAASNKPPGVALAAGAFLPSGFGTFKISHLSPYAYIALTENLENEFVLIHANLGILKSGTRDVTTWGIGSQVRLFGRFHGIAEVVSGDPYNEEARGGAAQIGFRHIVSQWVQIDGTYGIGIWGNPSLPYWAAAGVRWVFSP